MNRITRKPATITQAKADQIKAREAYLRKGTKAGLKADVERHYRVVDLRECSKLDLVWMLIEAEFGRRAVEAYADGRIEG